MDDFGELIDGSKPIEVELDAYVIAESHRVWKASAGKTHRFYKAVRDAHTVFPDVRGLDGLEGAPSTWRDEDLLPLIAADRWERELASRERGNKPQSAEGIGAQDRGVLTFLKRLWHEAAKGDLVVVPAEGYRENVLIGEFLTEAGDIRRVEAKDGEFTGGFYGRPVAWRIGLPKLLLDEDLIAALHTRAAVFTLGETEKESVYRLAYSNFVYKGRFVAEFRTTKNRFTAEDHAVLATWLNAFDVLRDSIERGETRPESFAELGLEKLPDERAAELKIDIQSPGEVFVRSVSPFALSLMALFALSACDSKQVGDNRVTVRLKHVGGHDNAIEKAVEEDVNAIKAALGEARIEQQANLARRARGDAYVSTRATLKFEGKGSK
ncbi:hypothetical protein [Sphingomonas sp. 3-13AW]|uniref:hypothetical protein n=1 Tax=Sphingomonas sp. 3-13AW TaxID=3050450 RepID=UPI003BB66DE3